MRLLGGLKSFRFSFCGWCDDLGPPKMCEPRISRFVEYSLIETAQTRGRL